MTVFGIMAEFPLGKYIGHRDGQTESYPTPARVHAALLCAAAQGPSAIETDGRLTPSPEDLSALQWLEENPPTGVVIPPCAQKRQQEIAYRQMGLLKAKMRGTKAAAKAATRGTAIQGSVGWAWEQKPPVEVRERLAALCRDVPYLGSAESPVRMRASELEPTHFADPAATLFDPGGLDLHVASDSRTSRLISIHEDLAAARRPTIAADRAKTDEADLATTPETSAMRIVKYRQVGDRGSSGPQPWDRVLVIDIDSGGARIDFEDRVSWSVALHRALISVVGYGAPPMITGRWEGQPPTSNHVAIQLVDVIPQMSFGYAGQQVFLLLVPHDAQPADVMQVVSAAERVTTLRRAGDSRTLRLSVASPLLAAGEFWDKPVQGLHRVWTTVPAAVPDSRPIRGAWSWSDTVALSVALTWRDFLPDVAGLPEREGVRRGDRKYVILADAAIRNGLTVHSVSPITTSTPDRYVHRMNSASVVRPYQAWVDLGHFGSCQTLAAIGQSRHLGGGFLMPVDVAGPVVASWASV